MQSFTQALFRQAFAAMGPGAPASAMTHGSQAQLKWSCLLGQFCGLAKIHQVGFHAAVRISAWLKNAASGVRLSSAV